MTTQHMDEKPIEPTATPRRGSLLCRRLILLFEIAVFLISTGGCHLSSQSGNPFDVVLISESEVCVAGNNVDFKDFCDRHQLHRIAERFFVDIASKQPKRAVVTVSDGNIRSHFLFEVVMALAHEVDFVEMPMDDGGTIRLSVYIFDPHGPSGDYFLDDVQIASGDTLESIKYADCEITNAARKIVRQRKNEKGEFFNLFCYAKARISDVKKFLNIAHEKGWRQVNLVDMGHRGFNEEEVDENSLGIE